MKLEVVDPRKHEWRGNGWRRHVPYYVGTYDPKAPFGIRAETKCSESQCELNKR